MLSPGALVTVSPAIASFFGIALDDLLVIVGPSRAAGSGFFEVFDSQAWTSHHIHRSDLVPVPTGIEAMREAVTDGQAS